MTLGDRIKAVRGPLSRDKFAPQTGISKTALVNYETNDRTPPSDYLVKILELFPDISPAWLLMGEGEMRREVRLSDSEAHQALKKRLKSLGFGNSIRSSAGHFGLDWETYRAYLFDNYEPTTEELEALCKIAGEWDFGLGRVADTASTDFGKEPHKGVSPDGVISKPNYIDVDDDLTEAIDKLLNEKSAIYGELKDGKAILIMTTLYRIYSRNFYENENFRRETLERTIEALFKLAVAPKNSENI